MDFGDRDKIKKFAIYLCIVNLLNSEDSKVTCEEDIRDWCSYIPDVEKKLQQLLATKRVILYSPFDSIYNDLAIVAAEEIAISNNSIIQLKFESLMETIYKNAKRLYRKQKKLGEKKLLHFLFPRNPEPHTYYVNYLAMQDASLIHSVSATVWDYWAGFMNSFCNDDLSIWDKYVESFSSKQKYNVTLAAFPEFYQSLEAFYKEKCGCEIEEAEKYYDDLVFDSFFEDGIRHRTNQSQWLFLKQVFLDNGINIDDLLDSYNHLEIDYKNALKDMAFAHYLRNINVYADLKNGESLLYANMQNVLSEFPYYIVIKLLIDLINGYKNRILQRDLKYFSLYEEVKCFREKTSKLQQLLQEQELSIKEMGDKLSTMQKCQYMNSVNHQRDRESMQNKIDALENRIEELKADRDTYIDTINELLDAVNENGIDVSENPVTPTISEKKVLFVGGFSEYKSALISFFPNAVFIDNVNIEVSVKNIDCIVFFIRYCSHALLYRIRSLYKDERIKRIYCKSTNIEVIIQEILKQMQ